MATLDVTRFEGFDPVIAAYLSPLDVGLARLIATLKKMTTEQLTVKPAGFKNTVATLAVHIAATEISFAYRIQGQPVPEELLAEYPPHKEEFLPEINGETVESLVAKLEKGRGILLNTVKGLTAADLEREIQIGPERTASVAWFLALASYHLALHTGHIGMIRQHI